MLLGELMQFPEVLVDPVMLQQITVVAIAEDESEAVRSEARYVLLKVAQYQLL